MYASFAGSKKLASISDFHPLVRKRCIHAPLLGAQYRAYIFPCQRITPALTDNQPMTRGLGGMLILTEQRTFTSNVPPALPGALIVPMRPSVGMCPA